MTPRVFHVIEDNYTERETIKIQMSQKLSGDSSRIQIDSIEDWFQMQKNFTDAIMSSLSQTHLDYGTHEAVKAHLLRVRSVNLRQKRASYASQ